MFCLHWIHFMDETEDSIDIKVNYNRGRVNYEHLAECSIFHEYDVEGYEGF